MKQQSFFLLGLAALCFSACKPKIEAVAPGAGNADFSTYVAVGNSLTAGYADNSLYQSGQRYAYPNILATQFRLVGGGDFKTPLLATDHGYPDAKLVLGYRKGCGDTVAALSAVPFTGPGNLAQDSMNVSAQGPYNNLGIPGIRAIDFLFQGYLFFNPYSHRMFPLSFTQRALDEITRIKATFFTLWIGNNDVLAYATSGGEGNLNGTGPGINDISSPAIFKAAFDSVLIAMTRRGAKGAVINIPDVTAIPFFNTVPISGAPLSVAEAVALNAQYAGTGISFTAGTNNYVIEDPTAPAGMRMLLPGELLLLSLPMDSVKCFPFWGTGTPIPKRYVLDATEVANVRNATATFNQIMAQGAGAKGLAYVDMNSFLKTVRAGVQFNGVSFNTAYVQGGAFSLDGVHLNPRGNALVANEVIRVVNNFYGASIPAADVNSYPGLSFP